MSTLRQAAIAVIERWDGPGCGLDADITALRAALEAPEPYDQQALEPCDKCGWKAVIPGDPCLNCGRGEVMKALDAYAAERDAALQQNTILDARCAKLEAAAKLANSYIEWLCFGNCRADDGPIPTASEVSAALKKAGVQ